MKTSIPRAAKKRIAGHDWTTLVNRRPGRLSLGAKPGSREDNRVTIGPTAGFWTIAELDPATGEILQTFDRGVSRDRELSADVCLLLGSDGSSLYAAGSSSINGGYGYLIKYDINTGEQLWQSDDGALKQIAPRNLFSTITERVDQTLCEADDGAIWMCRAGQHADSTGAAKPPYVGRYDPDTGEQTHQYGPVASLGWALYPAASGAVVVASPGIPDIRRLSATATLTHTLAATSQTAIADDGTNLIVVGGRAIKIVSKADLSLVASATTALGVGESFLAVATDGTTIYTATSEATPKYRAFNYSLSSTWNAARDATLSTSWEQKAVNSKLYDFCDLVRKLNPANGAEIWTSLPATGHGLLRRRTAVAIGSDFTISGHTTTTATTGTNSIDPLGIICLEEATGALRWYDNVTCHAIQVTADDRIFVCHNRRGHTLNIAP